MLPTPEGEEFLGYARQLLNQYELLEDRFIRRTRVKKKFSVSMQHYSFAVKAFVELVKQYGMDEYEFAVYETRPEKLSQMCAISAAKSEFSMKMNLMGRPSVRY